MKKKNAVFCCQKILPYKPGVNYATTNLAKLDEAVIL